MRSEKIGFVTNTSGALVLKLMMLFFISFLFSSEAWGNLRVRRGGVTLPYNVGHFSLLPPLQSGDSIIAFNSATHIGFGGDVTIPANVVIIGEETNPDNFPRVRIIDQNHRLRLGAGVRISRISFESEAGDPNGHLQIEGNNVVIDKCIFNRGSGAWIYNGTPANILRVTNSIIRNLAHPFYRVRANDATRFYIFNNTFHNNTATLIYDENHHTPAGLIYGNIFSNCQEPVSNRASTNDNVARSVFHSSNSTGIEPVINLIVPTTGSLGFVGGVNPTIPTDFRLTETSPAINYVLFRADLPTDDIGGHSRAARTIGDFNDAGAWEYQDFDPPRFVRINNFSVVYNTTARPPWQSAFLEFNITIASADWDTIMIRYNNNFLNIDNIATRFPQHNTNTLLFRWSRQELENNSNFTVIHNAAENTWTISTNEPILISKAQLDIVEGTSPILRYENIFGRGYYFTMFLSDAVGNWTNRDAADTQTPPRNPITTMRVPPMQSLSDSTTITREASQHFSFWLDARLNEAPTHPRIGDFSGVATLSLDHGQLFLGDTPVGQVQVNIVNGRVLTPTNLNIRAPGTYRMNLSTVVSTRTSSTVTTPIVFNDHINITIISQPIVDFVHPTTGASLPNLDMANGAFQTVGVTLRRDGNPIAGTVTVGYVTPGAQGRLNGGTIPINLAFTGAANEIRTFTTLLPLNQASRVHTFLVNSPHVNDTINVVNATNMQLVFTNPQDSLVTHFDRLSLPGVTARLTTAAGSLVSGANLRFEVVTTTPVGAATIVTPTSTTNAQGLVQTDINAFRINATTQIRVRDEHNAPGLQDLFHFVATPVTFRFVDRAGVYSVTPGGAATPDTIRGFNSLSFPVDARLVVNNNEVRNVAVNFSVQSGTATLGGVSSGTTNDMGIVTAPNFSFTPGAVVQVRFSAASGGGAAVTRDFVIMGNRETVSFIADRVSGEANSTVNLIAEYRIDGSPVNGADLVFTRPTWPATPEMGTFVQTPTTGPVTIRTSTQAGSPGRANAEYVVQVARDENLVTAHRLGAGTIIDTVVVARVITAPDNIQLLRRISATQGDDGPVSFTAGENTPLLVRITGRGQPIAGTLSTVTITNSLNNPNFRFSVDGGTTWWQSGTSINTPIPATGFLTIHITDTRAGVITVRAEEPSAGMASRDVTIVPAAPDPSVSTFVANPTDPFVQGVGLTPDHTVLTATIMDRFRNVIPNIMVFRPTGLPSATVQIGRNLGVADGSTVTVQTNAQGQAVFRAWNRRAEQVTFSVSTTGGITLTSQPLVTFMPGFPDAIASQPIRIFPDTAIANGTDIITIEVNLVDINGNPISGVRLADFPNSFIRIGGSESNVTQTLTPIISVTNAEGLLRWHLTDTRAQRDTVFIRLRDVFIPPSPIAVFIPGPLHRIEIEDAPTNGQPVTNRTVVAGDTVRTFFAVGYDANNNRIGLITANNWGFVGEVGTPPNHNHIAPTANTNNTWFYPRRVGQGRIWVTHNAVTDTTGILTITGGAPHTVRVATENHQYEQAGVNFGVRLTLFDRFGNQSPFSGNQQYSFSYIRVGEPLSWHEPRLSNPTFTFANGVSTGWQGPFTLYSSDVLYYLLATAGSVTTDTTGSIITVRHGEYVELRVLTGFSGFTEPFDDTTRIDIRTNLPMHAVAFDSWGNYVGPVTNARWTLGSGSLTTETFTDAFGTVRNFFTFNAHDSSVVNNEISGIIRATDTLHPTRTGTTGVIEVFAIPDHILIRGNPRGTPDTISVRGNPNTSYTIYIRAGTTFNFFSVAYDTFSAPINLAGNSEVPSTWRANFGIAGAIEGPASSGTWAFRRTLVDTGSVNATAVSPTIRQRNDTTMQIIILPGSPHAILVNVIQDVVAAGDSVPVELILVDEFGNVVNTPEGTITINNIRFTIDPDGSTPPPHSRTAIYPAGPFTFARGRDTTHVIFARANNAGETTTITAREDRPGGLTSGNADTVRIIAGPPHHIKIMYGNNPAVDITEAGNRTLTIDDRLTLHAILYDRMGNFLGITEADWTTAGFTPEFESANSRTLTIGTFNGLATGADVFARPRLAGVLADTAFNFNVIAGRVAGYMINVHEALGLERPMGDTVAANFGFSISVRLVDRIGNFITSPVLDTHTLGFRWTFTRTSVADLNNVQYEFLNGEAIIFIDSHPFMMDRFGIDSLLVFNVDNQSIRGTGRFWAVDRFGPRFADEHFFAFDTRGDGFIDSIVVKFDKPIDISRLNNGLISAFELVADPSRNDNVTQWLEVIGIRVLDSTSIALIVGLRANAPAGLLPITDIEPTVRFLGNAGLPDDTGIFDISGNSMAPGDAPTTERVGVVITRATIDDGCDAEIANDALILLLSENVSFDTLQRKDPAIGIRIIRIEGTQQDTISLFPNTATYEISLGVGNTVRIRTRDAVNLMVGFDYAQLIVGGGYRDTTIYRTDVHPNNTPRKIRFATGVCYNMFRSIPNPVLRPGSIGMSGGAQTAGAIFVIPTDRPISLKFNVFNMHGNFVNSFNIDVTWEILNSYGQEDGERVNIYFGAGDPTNEGYLRPIPSSYFASGVNVDEIPANMKWLPVNKNNRIVESGVYVLRVYINNEHKTNWNMIVR